MFDSISERVSVWWLYFYYSFLVHLGLKSCFKNDSFLKSTFYILFSAIDFVLFLFLILTLKNSVYCLPSNLDWSFLFSMFFWIPFFRFFQSLVLMFDLFLETIPFSSLYFYYSFLIHLGSKNCSFDSFLESTFSIPSSRIDSHDFRSFLLTHKNHSNCFPSNPDQSLPFSFLFILPPFSIFDFYCSRSIRI